MINNHILEHYGKDLARPSEILAYHDEHGDDMSTKEAILAIIKNKRLTCRIGDNGEICYFAVIAHPSCLKYIRVTNFTGTKRYQTHWVLGKSEKGVLKRELLLNLSDMAGFEVETKYPLYLHLSRLKVYVELMLPFKRPARRLASSNALRVPKGFRWQMSA